MFIPSYIKDTGHFLYILQHLGPLPQGTLLVTYDVTSLYTNIPLAEAEQAVARMLILARPHACPPSNQSLLRLLRHVFQGNIFSFCDGNKLHYYLQVNGVSMGSKCAPSVACTFMGDFERTHTHSLPSDQPKPHCVLRFIDHVFAIWTHGPEAQHDFTTWLNAWHTNIKFTCSHSETSVTFLDTMVLLKDDHLETELFIKPTLSLSFLHRHSSHPSHVFNSLPYGEFLRVRRNCSTRQSFEHFSEIILEAFIHRGYDRASLDGARQQARTIDRSSLLETYANLQASNGTDQESADTSTKDFYLILQHHVENTKIKQLLKRNWTILGTSDLTSSLFQGRSICWASRNPRLRDMLVCSSLPLNPQFGKTGKSNNICTTSSCEYCHTLDMTGLNAKDWRCQSYPYPLPYSTFFNPMLHGFGRGTWNHLQPIIHHLTW